MEKRQIINIVNFIRGVEPRADVDLIKPVAEQIKLIEKYNFKATFLVQYDALINPKFTEILRSLCQDRYEIGVWFEIVQPMAEKAGIKWRGRFPWDWHAHCGFSVGYTRQERERLIDVLFEKFKEVFGYYPVTLGSWVFDAHSLEYANNMYGLDAACNCKDQCGTDGYTLWGGYYGQGYYPSRFNSYTPAKSKDTQIDVPVFRMLGSDPIHQYDSGVDITKRVSEGVHGVFTMEPVYTTEAGGGIPSWVDWYLKENFSGNCITFGYAQIGQENSFGWEAMEKGLKYQFEAVSKLVNNGCLKVETLAETGRWYKKSFDKTPASSITAFSDWKGKNRRSIWYNCINYRANLYAEEGRFWIRDIYIFRDGYKERYFDSVCQENEFIYDNLPFVDGNRFSGSGVRAGLYIADEDGKDINGMKYENIVYKESDSGITATFTGTKAGDILVSMSENGIYIKADKNFCLIRKSNKNSPFLPKEVYWDKKQVRLCYEGFVYSVSAKKGIFTDNFSTASENCQVALVFTE